MSDPASASETAPAQSRRRVPTVRGFAVALLLFIGGVSSISASVGVWTQRAIIDEDGFSSRVDEVIDRESVQVLLATRFADEVSEVTDIEERLGGALSRLEDLANESRPRGEQDRSLTVLTAPLTTAFDRLVFESALLVLESEALKTERQFAVRALHTQALALINEDDEAVLQRQSGKLVINLRPLLTDAVRRADVRAGDELLLSLDIPETAGQVVIGDESDYDWLGRAIRFADDLLLLLLAIPIVCLSAAVALSPDRRRGVIAAGLVIAIAAAVLFLALRPLEELLVLIVDPENDTAARATIDVLLVQDLRVQSLITIFGGLALVTGAWLAGKSRVWPRFRTNG